MLRYTYIVCLVQRSFCHFYHVWVKVCEVISQNALQELQLITWGVFHDSTGNLTIYDNLWLTNWERKENFMTEPTYYADISLGRPSKTTKTFSQYSQCPGRVLNPPPVENKPLFVTVQISQHVCKQTVREDSSSYRAMYLDFCQFSLSPATPYLLAICVTPSIMKWCVLFS